MQSGVKGPGIQCSNCGSRETDDFEGQLTCAKCGLVLAARQVVLEQQDVKEGDLVNLRRVRNKPGRKQKRAKQGRDGDDDLETFNREQCFHVFDRVCGGLQKHGFLSVNIPKATQAVEDRLQQLGTRRTSSREATEIAYGALYAYLGETTITAWDLCHLATVGAIPCLEFVGMERGPYYLTILEVKDSLTTGGEELVQLDEKAVAFRFAYLFAKFLDMSPRLVWRAAWLVLFGLGGKAGGARRDAIGLAAGVATSIVMIEGWEEKVLSALATKGLESFCFSPIGKFTTSSKKVLDQLETDVNYRRKFFLRQNVLIRSLENDSKRVLESNVEQFLGSKCEKANPLPDEQYDEPVQCDGDCLEILSKDMLRHRGSLTSLKDLDIWKHDIELRYADDVIRAMDGLRKLASKGLDRDLVRSERGNEFGTIYREMRRIAAEASVLKVHEKVNQFWDDSRRIWKMGCTKLLCCPRRGLPRDSIKGSKRPYKSRATKCKTCENCLRTKDCNECVACLAKYNPELGLTDDQKVKTSKCLQRKCLIPVLPNNNDRNSSPKIPGSSDGGARQETNDDEEE